MDIEDTLYESDDVYRSWADGRVVFAIERPGGRTAGLRKPQRAAAFAVFSHLDSDPATPGIVVMPTGTGKTDTIFAIAIARLFARTLIVVPSDALRTQIGDRLQTLGRLRSIGVIDDSMLSPRVYRVTGRAAALDTAAIRAANVTVATPASFAELNDDELREALTGFTHVIFDEAHHVAARSWRRIQETFEGRPALYFTATPFRLDEQRLNGKIIFNYSLRQAQIDGYFQQIEFFPVREYIDSQVDRAIATRAVELLRHDLAAGRDHLLVARCSKTSKADELVTLYEELASDLSPVVMHSKTTGNAMSMQQLMRRDSRIVVCVDMFGEGFDFPQLKVAAIHDQHQSPAVTLQFIGRLTRTDASLGTAKFVANIANQREDGAMKRLYEESADWSHIIREVSAERIGREIARQEFEAQFEGDDDAARIVALDPEPNVSATAYRVRAPNWHPNLVAEFNGPHEVLELHSVSAAGDIVMAVTRESAPVSWTASESVRTTTWHLYLAYYRRVDSTLFVTCTSDDRQRLRFLKLIASHPGRIDGEDVFRIMSGLNRLKLQNVGLSRSGRDVRFTMHVGQDVNGVMDDLENGRSIKSNIFGVGFANSGKTTAGCSSKGKLWKMDSAGIDEWVRWCDEVSSKINDPAVNTASILTKVMRAERLLDRWPAGIFFADWPDSLLVETEQRTSVTVDTVPYSILDLKMGLPTREQDTVLEIPLFAEREGEPDVELLRIRAYLHEDGVTCSAPGASISTGRRTDDLGSYLEHHGMRFLVADGSIVIGNVRHYAPDTLDVPLPDSLMAGWEWGDTNIHRESMGYAGDLQTVQGFTYTKIADDYDIVFNDDGAGEVADLVCVREAPDHIQVDLFHCKYCNVGDAPGARRDDAYVVVGQAARSVRWLHRGPDLFKRLLDRENKAHVRGRSRLLKGSLEQIDRCRRKSRDVEMRMGFYIVQPAFAKSRATPELMGVLGTSYKYIKDIAGVDVRVYCSP